MDVKKYIFTQKLKGKRVCIIYSVSNGFYAELLEQCGIWERLADTRQGEMVWTAKYPLSIKYGDTRHDLEVGDQFTLSI